MFLSPGEGAISVEVAPGGPISAEQRHAHDDLGALLDRLGAGVAVEVGLGEAGLDRVDPHATTPAGSRFSVAGPDLRIMVYTAEPGTQDAERLALLAVLGTQTLVESPDPLPRVAVR